VPSSSTAGQTHIVIYHENKERVNDLEDDDKQILIEMKQQIDRLVEEVERLNAKVEELQAGKSTPFFGAEVAPAPCGLNVWRMSSPPEMACEVDDLPPAQNMLQVLINKLPSASVSGMDEESEAEATAEPAEPAEEAEAAEEAEVAEEEVAEEEEEEEEEALELEEFEYKGVTYYKDSDNQVYQKDDDGDLDDTPIGVWNEQKEKIQKYAKAA